MAQGKIVLMACGSFSPPTFMHLRMFEIARDQIHSTGVGTVIGGIVSPVHDAYGKKDLVAAHHRMAMLRLALRSSGWLKLSDWEARQAGWTRTRLSLQHHQDTINAHLSRGGSDAFPAWLPDDILNNALDEPDDLMTKLNGNHGDDNGCHGDTVTVKLLCGADLLESFATPGLWSEDDLEAIVGQHGLVVVTRAGNDPGRFVYESDALYRHRNNIHIITNYISNEVSSTVLRRLLRRHESIKYLTDDSVIAYVKQHRLYGATTDNEYTPSPQDIPMASPDETSYKNILISIRDRPSIVGETVTVKRARRANFLMPYSRSDCVAPLGPALTPKSAYVEPAPLAPLAPPAHLPGKAVKIVSDVTDYKIQGDQVSYTENYSSLETYLSKDDDSSELYKRRLSDGNVCNKTNDPPKKRCSSTVRKLNPEEMKKSKSEVSKLCDKMKSIKLKENSGKSYKTRSCNDIVRLILTKHGIHVISDTEAIV